MLHAPLSSPPRTTMEHGSTSRFLPSRSNPVATPSSVPGPSSCLGLDLHELAEDLAGPIDRDELTSEELALFSDVLDEVVLATLARVAEVVEAELGPRIETLPLHARLALANARLRRDLGAE